MISQIPFAYVCAPFSYGDQGSIRRSKEYCIQVYRLGFVPMCPKLYFTWIMSETNQDMKRDIQVICQSVLRRCKLIIVCSSDTVTPDMEAELYLAGKLNIIATTLQGMQRLTRYTRPVCD